MAGEVKTRENVGAGRGKGGEAESSFRTSQRQDYFSVRHTGATPAMAPESQPLRLSPETSLGMLRAIRGNVMPRWEF